MSLLQSKAFLIISVWIGFFLYFCIGLSFRYDESQRHLLFFNALFTSLATTIIAYYASIIATGIYRRLLTGIEPSFRSLPGDLSDSEHQTEMDVFTLARDILRNSDNTSLLLLFSNKENMGKLVPFIDDQGHTYYQGKPASYEDTLNLIRDAARRLDRGSFDDIAQRVSGNGNATVQTD